MGEQVWQNHKGEIHWKVVFNASIGYLRVEARAHGINLINQEWNNLGKGGTASITEGPVALGFTVNDKLVLEIHLYVSGKPVLEELWQILA